MFCHTLFSELYVALVWSGGYHRGGVCFEFVYSSIQLAGENEV